MLLLFPKDGPVDTGRSSKRVYCQVNSVRPIEYKAHMLQLFKQQYLLHLQHFTRQIRIRKLGGRHRSSSPPPPVK
ncbi:hypothetical protein L6452_35072 [Arctium lappa]|uniref:Uncharacterized protein n=1 Tax=Arctium lappa TaxID=4217 RepID=A0ACB8YK80_ARCLA|nr:hypothetical protein L6452_35072 [Arctium lappa]